MTPELRAKLIAGITDGSIVPYIGPGVLADVKNAATGAPIPADSDSLIYAMNDGKPMAPKLMYEFPRAAMNVELKRGRTAVTKFLTRTYGETAWTRGAFHDWLKDIAPPYVIDINRDTQLLDSYAHVPHTLILGCARLGGSDYRFRLYTSNGEGYVAAIPEAVNTELPILFKPLGCPRPHPSYIASDADFVDYITELMGGFAVPAFIKTLRQGKRYLLLGMRFHRDTERMVLSDLMFGAATPAGWALISDPTDKERRFLERLNIEIVESAWTSLLERAPERV